jgi:hypothetical protein
MIHFRLPRIFSVVFTLGIGLGVCLCPPACSRLESDEPQEFQQATQVVLDWNNLLLELEWHTPGYRPPVTARMFAYAEMAAYEAALPSLPQHVSLQVYLPGYRQPEQPSFKQHLPASVNAAFAHIARVFFPSAAPHLLQKIQALEARHQLEARAVADDTTLQQSIGFGKKVAQRVWEYSMTDSLGHDAFMYNYDRGFQAKNCAGCWAPDAERPMPALLPHWGETRGFLVSAEEIPVKPPAPYNDSPQSLLFSEAMEVFNISQSLTSEDRWVAEFWSDDVPGLTITPSGRWMSIATQAIDKARLPFSEVIALYVKTAFALCDAGIICWAHKYNFQLERPDTYIRRNIKADWTPLHGNPAFPSYPSGHAIFGGAAAIVLSDVLGNNFEMTDRTHEKRKEFAGKPRKFDSFQDMAHENAYSRVLIGVHYRMDCEEGLRLGTQIGQKISKMSLHKNNAAIFRQ